MDLALTADQEALRARARALADTIKEHELDCEEQNGLGPEAHAQIAARVRELRLNAINMPSEWGGQGLGVLDQVLVQEELGVLTNALWDTVWRPANALRACTPEQRASYLEPAIRGELRDCFAVTEAGAGSDPSLIQTTAEPAEGGYRLNGEKWFVTVGDVADFLIVLALVRPEGAPTLFLVDKDTPGVTVLRTPRYMHTFVYEHPEFGFEDAFVPASAVLGGVGEGYELTRDWFVEERLMIAARTVGAAERALRSAVDWAGERAQFGQELIGYQLIQGMIADSVVDISTNRALVRQVAWEADQGIDRRLLHGKAAVVKLSASEAAGRVVDRALQIHGGRGYMRENPCERLYRDLRVDRIWEGTSEIQTRDRGQRGGEARARRPALVRHLAGAGCGSGGGCSDESERCPDLRAHSALQVRTVSRWERRRLGEPPGVRAAVDHDRRAGDVGAGVRGEEGDQARDLLRPAEPAERDRALPCRDGLLAVALERLGGDRPGRHADAADAVPAPLERQPGGEICHGGPARRGVGEARDPAQRAESDEDDQPAAARNQRTRGDCMCDAPDGVEGDALHRAPPLQRDLLGGRRELTARVVDEHVELAEALEGGTHDPLDLALLAQVGRQREALAAPGLDGSGRLLERLRAPPADRDASACSGQLERGRPPDAGPPSGHERDTAGVGVGSQRGARARHRDQPSPPPLGNLGRPLGPASFRMRFQSRRTCCGLLAATLRVSPGSALRS